MAQQLRNLRRILEKLRMLLNQENPNELDIKVYCDCLETAGHQHINFPHLALDLAEFGCLAMSRGSDGYLQNMVVVIHEILGGQLFVPQVDYACPYRQAILENLAAPNILPPPPPPVPAED